MRPIAALLALAACDAPYGECTPGMVRDPGPACTAPRLTVVVDGDPAEWADVEPIATRIPEWAGDVTSIRVALDGDAMAVAVFLGTEGPPLPAAEASYVFAMDDRFTGSFDHGSYAGVEVDTEGLVRWWMNYEILFDLPVESAFGATGVELRFPLAVLPFSGEAFVDAWVSPGADGAVVVVTALDQPLCWDPTRLLSCH